MHRHQQARARRWATIVGIAGLATFSLLGVALRDGAHGAQFPASAEAILLLDGTQTSPPDGFNMQIDDNGFTTAGGAQTFTHMFCVQSVLHYRCGIGANDLIRVQRTPVDAQLSQAQANQVAWILTHRAGYDNQETQLAIWCITNPGVNAPFGNSDALCAAAKSSAVPAAPTLTLTPLGSAQVSEGASVHFSLSTNAPTVNLSVSDGGANATLCGTNLANAAATLNGAVLQQTIPATQRTFELCLTRANVASGSVAASLTATLDATAANLQTWVHPTAPTKCQGLVDTGVSASRISASAQGTWANVDGSLTVTKSVYGNAPTNSIFSVTVSEPSTLAQVP